MRHHPATSPPTTANSSSAGSWTPIRSARSEKAFNLEGATELTGEEPHDAVLNRGTPLPLANGWRLARRTIAGDIRIELEGPDDTDTRTPCASSAAPSSSSTGVPASSHPHRTCWTASSPAGPSQPEILAARSCNLIRRAINHVPNETAQPNPAHNRLSPHGKRAQSTPAPRTTAISPDNQRWSQAMKKTAVHLPDATYDRLRALADSSGRYPNLPHSPSARALSGRHRRPPHSRAIRRRTPRLRRPNFFARRAGRLSCPGRLKSRNEQPGKSRTSTPATQRGSEPICESDWHCSTIPARADPDCAAPSLETTGVIAPATTASSANSATTNDCCS